MRSLNEDLTADNVHPISDLVLLQREDTEDMTAGGIALPDTVKEVPYRCTVLRVGPGKMLEDGSRQGMQVKPGQKVLTTKYAGTAIKPGKTTGGLELVLVRESEILAIDDGCGLNHADKSSKVLGAEER